MGDESDGEGVFGGFVTEPGFLRSDSDGGDWHGLIGG